MNNKVIFLIKTVFTLVLLYIIYEIIDFSKFLSLISGAKLNYLLIMCALWPVSVFLSSSKWKLVLKHYRIDVSYTQAFNLYWVGSFFNNFLPTSIGGDSYKFVFLNKRFKGKKAEIVSSMIIERGIGVFSMVLSTLFFGFFFLDKLLAGNLKFLYLAAIIVFLAVFSYLFFFSSISFKTTYKFEVLNKIFKLLNTLFGFKDKKTFFIGLLYSIMFFALSMCSIYLAFLAFNYEISIALLFFVMPLLNFSEFLPFSINSLGIKEGVGIYLFSLFEVNKEIVLLVLLTSRALLAICSITGGLRYLVNKEIL